MHERNFVVQRGGNPSLHNTFLFVLYVKKCFFDIYNGISSEAAWIIYGVLWYE